MNFFRWFSFLGLLFPRSVATVFLVLSYSLFLLLLDLDFRQCCACKYE